MEKNLLFRIISYLLMINLIIPVMSLSSTIETHNEIGQPEHLITAGTHLKDHIQINSPATSTFTRKDILRSGADNVADFIRNLPINSFGSLNLEPGNSRQGESEVSIRGLGANRSLVLIDGRRMAKSPIDGSSQNLNLIPLDAILKIEVLPTVSSALHGSDAIGGVINIITRKESKSGEIILRTSNPSISSNGGDRKKASITLGTHSDRFKLFAGISWNQRDAVYHDDVPWNQDRFSIAGNNFSTVSSQLFSAVDGGCSFNNSNYILVPSTISLNGRLCRYDTDSEVIDEASTQLQSFYANATHQINDRWLLSVNTLYTEFDSFSEFAPANSSFLSSISINSINNPTNPNSPAYDPLLGLDSQPVFPIHGFAVLDNRSLETIDQMLNLKVGLEGQIGSAHLSLGLRHTNNQSERIRRNFLLVNAANEFIENGQYNLLNPFETSQSVINSIRTDISQQSKYSQSELFSALNFNWLSLPGGDLSWAIGVNYQRDQHNGIFNPRFNLVDFNDDEGVSAQQHIFSVFIESSLPLSDKTDINLVSRIDDNSEFNTTFSAQASVFHQVNNQLSLQGSWNKGHRTPTLAEANLIEFGTRCFALNPTSTISCGRGVEALIDEQIVNPQLAEEQVNQFQVGLHYQPLEWLEINLNYQNVHLKDQITYINNSFLRALQRRLNLPPGLGCDRIDGANDPDLPPISCQTGRANLGSIRTDGIDFDLNINYGSHKAQFSHFFKISHTLEYKTDIGFGSSDTLNLQRLPDFRAQLINSLSIKNWDLTHIINIIDQPNNLNFPTWVTHDVQINYSTQLNSIISIGAQNITAKEPPINQDNFLNSSDFNSNLYNGFGRIIFANYTHTF